VGHDERRRSVRHTISAVVQVVDLGSGMRLTTRASDLSLGGCYVEALTPFSVGSEVRIGLHKDNNIIEMNGKIVYSSSGLGMGIAFTEVEADHQAALEEWLNTLQQEKTGASAPHPAASAEPKAPAMPTTPATPRTFALTAAGPDARVVVARLVHLLVAKGVLSEDDAEMILQHRQPVI
jgi:hypothetical protein